MSGDTDSNTNPNIIAMVREKVTHEERFLDEFK